MKKLFSFSILLLILIMPLMAVGCGAQNTHIDLNLSIVNFSEFEDLLVADYTSIDATANNIAAFSNAQESNIVSTKKTNQEKPKLFGRHHNGSFEKIKYEESSDFESNYFVSAIQKLGNFVFINFARDVNKIYNTYNNSPQDYGFVLDKKTGKMFDITKYGVNIYTSGVYGVSNDAFFSLLHLNGNSHGSIYKFSIVDGRLEIKELIDLRKVSSFGIEYKVDRYGNIFSKNGKYILTSQGELRRLDSKVNVAFNGIAYSGNSCFDKNGDLVPATWVPSNFLNMKDYYEAWNQNIIYQSDNEIYYRDLRYSKNKIIKYTILNDIEYKVEEIIMQKSEDNTGVVLNERIYFLNDSQIYYVTIKDGSYFEISSEYIFNSIYSDNLGNICFTAVTNNLDNVEGIINYTDNSVEIKMFKNDYKVFYVEPLLF